jgi:WD40 repeat protein
MPPSILQDVSGKATAIPKWTAALMLLPLLGLTAAADPQAPKADRRQPRVDRLGDPLPEEVVARLGSGRMRHPFSFRKLAFSPDGKSIVSGAANGIRIWDAATGRLRRRFDVDTDWSLDFVFTAEGIAVASAGLDKGIVAVQVVDPAGGTVRRRIEMPDRITACNLTFSADGKQLAYTHEKTVRLYDPASGREMLRIPVKGPEARNLAFAADGKSIAICDGTDTASLHDTTGGQCLRRFKHDGDVVWWIAFSPDGRLLASMPFNDKQREIGEISIWEVATGKERHRWKFSGGQIGHAAFSPDGKYAVVNGPYPDLVLCDLATGKEVRRFTSQAASQHSVFSPDGKTLAAGGSAICLWDVATGRVLPGSADPSIWGIMGLRFSGDGRRLIGFSAMPIAWDPRTGREIRRFAKVGERPWWTRALSPDETLLACPDGTGTIQLWNAATGEKVRSLKGHEEWVWRTVFSADGRRLVSSSADGTIRVWDVADGRELHKLTGDRMLKLAVSADGRWLASASDKRGPRGLYEVVLWDLGTGREHARFPLSAGIQAGQMAFSPDSRLLAVGGHRGNWKDPGAVAVWDVADGKEWRSLEGHTVGACSVAFSPDGRTLATGDGHGTLLLWELASARKRLQFIGHESDILSLAYSPDGRLLAASSPDAPAYVWDVLGTTEQPPRTLSPQDLQRCWTALAGDDATVAFGAIRRLAAAPEQTLPLLRELLKAVPEPDARRVRQLVEALDSNEFEQRRKAAAELEKSADAAGSLLRQILEKEKSSLEVRRALRQILEAQETAPEALRAVRAVEVLEWIAAPEAERLLGELAKGAADARLTCEAAAAQRRLRR